MKTNHEESVERKLKFELERTKVESANPSARIGHSMPLAADAESSRENLNGQSAGAPSNALPLLHIKKILHPTDFSPPSARALAYAKKLAEHFQAELAVVHVIPFVYSPCRYPEMDYFEAHISSRQEAEDRLREIAEDPAITETILTEGRSDDEIVRLAHESEADLIVISTHGTSGIKHLLIGSTAEKVVRHAPCPVLVVKEHERDFISLQ